MEIHMEEHRPRCNATAPSGRIAGGGKRKVAAVAGAPAEPRYRGVLRRRRGRYVARTYDRKGNQMWLCTFDTAEEASRRYDSETRRLHGSSAITNFPATSDNRVPLLAPSLHAVDEHSFAADESQPVVESSVSTTPPPKPVDATAETLSTFSSSDEADAGGGAEAAAGPRKFVMEIHMEEHHPRCNATVPTGRVAGGSKRKAAAAGASAEPRYKGVLRRRRGRYAVRTCDRKGKRMWLSTFDTAEEAARRYDSETRRLRGSSAITNFPATSDDRVSLPAPSLHAVDKHSFAADESQPVVGSPVSTTPLPKHVDAAAETLSMFSSSDEADAGGGAEAAAGPRKFVMEIHMEEHRPRCNATVPTGRVAGGGKRKAAAASASAEPRYRGMLRWRRGRYIARTRDRKGKRMWLGTFDTTEEAARRYDSETRRLRGPSAITNFPAMSDDRVPLPTPLLHAVDEHSFAPDESQPVVGSPVSTTPPPKPVDAVAETRGRRRRNPLHVLLQRRG
uniref:AP2/ERF domain-containing protein n=1 Tax=Zea mays TaxID=4577 RepID=A0A804LFD3_MAIZE